MPLGVFFFVFVFFRFLTPMMTLFTLSVNIEHFQNFIVFMQCANPKTSILSDSVRVFHNHLFPVRMLEAPEVFKLIFCLEHQPNNDPFYID